MRDYGEDSEGPISIKNLSSQKLMLGGCGGQQPHPVWGAVGMPYCKQVSSVTGGLPQRLNPEPVASGWLSLHRCLIPCIVHIYWD